MPNPGCINSSLLSLLSSSTPFCCCCTQFIILTRHVCLQHPSCPKSSYSAMWLLKVHGHDCRRHIVLCTKQRQAKLTPRPPTNTHHRYPSTKPTKSIHQNPPQVSVTICFINSQVLKKLLGVWAAPACTWLRIPTTASTIKSGSYSSSLSTSLISLSS